MSEWTKDPTTGKEWGPISEKEMMWNEAQKWAKEHGGRVAKRWELIQLCDDGLREIVDTMLGKKFWSSFSGNNTVVAWYVNFNNGYVGSDYKANNKFARCVRP